MLRERRTATFARRPNPLPGFATGARWSVILVAAAAGASILATAPAFNSDHRALDPWGDWRRVSGAALYDLGQHRRDTGVGYLAWSMRDGDADTGDADAAARARALFEASLAEAPADAYAWSMLAWSERLLGNVEAALRAQRHSWRLAPHHATLARDRLALAASLADWRPDAHDRRALARDVASLNRLPRERNWLRSLAVDVPWLATIMADLAADEESLSRRSGTRSGHRRRPD